MVDESWIGFAVTSSGALDRSKDWRSVCDCEDCGCCCGDVEGAKEEVEGEV